MRGLLLVPTEKKPQTYKLFAEQLSGMAPHHQGPDEPLNWGDDEQVWKLQLRAGQSLAAGGSVERQRPEFSHCRRCAEEVFTTGQFPLKRRRSLGVLVHLAN
jgi:hypothetical protein